MGQFGRWLTELGGTMVAKVLTCLAIGVAGSVLVRLMLRLLDQALVRSRLERTAHNLIKTLARTVLYILLGLILASALGLDVTGIVALASVATLALSLALQNMLSNVIGGFTLLYTHPFKAGDYVEIAGQGGTVLEVGMSYTKLATPDNRLISIPNSTVVTAQIVNDTAAGIRRVDITVNVSYDTPVQQVLDILRSAANHGAIQPQPQEPFAALSKYGESAIEYTLRFWVKSEDYWTAMYAVNQDIKQAFEEARVTMTYPHLNVHLKK